MEKRPTLYNLQYLRAIAAIWVVWGHSTFQIDKLDPFLREVGIFGVDIFFVLSGFVMVYIAKPSDQPVQFMKRRIQRIVPLYWFFTFVMAATLIFAPQVFKNASFEFDAFWKSLFFVPCQSIVNPDEIWPIVSPGWTLNYEMYFYLLFGLTLFAKPTFRVPILIWVISGLCVIANLMIKGDGADNVIATFYANTIVFEFVFGMLLAGFFLSGKSIPTPLAIGLVIAGFVLLILELPVARVIGFGIPALMIVAGLLYIKLPKINWLAFLGDASYSIYISHLFFLGACRVVLKGFMPGNLFGAILFSLLATVGCTIGGCLVHLLIDSLLLKPKKLKGLLSRTAN